jgi:hypothetical protein
MDSLQILNTRIHMKRPGWINKSRSKYSVDNEASFGGFNIQDIEDFKSQKQRTKSNIAPDDEVTNTDTAIDFFGDKVKKNNEEDLPSFGSLVCDANKEHDRSIAKSISINKLSSFDNIKPSKPFMSKPQSDYAKKSSIAPVNTSNQFMSDKARDGSASAGFGAFGMTHQLDQLPNPHAKSSQKPKRLSVWDDDELLFAVAQNNQK